MKIARGKLCYFQSQSCPTLYYYTFHFTFSAWSFCRGRSCPSTLIRFTSHFPRGVFCRDRLVPSTIIQFHFTFSAWSFFQLMKSIYVYHTNVFRSELWPTSTTLYRFSSSFLSSKTGIVIFLYFSAIRYSNSSVCQRKISSEISRIASGSSRRFHSW